MDRSRQTVSARILVFAITLYSKLISPLFPAACRFHPTCSQYARNAIVQHGSVRGAWMAVKRIGRCHPFHPGGEDPVR